MVSTRHSRTGRQVCGLRRTVCTYYMARDATHRYLPLFSLRFKCDQMIMSPFLRPSRPPQTLPDPARIGAWLQAARATGGAGAASDQVYMPASRAITPGPPPGQNRSATSSRRRKSAQIFPNIDSSSRGGIPDHGRPHGSQIGVRGALEARCDCAGTWGSALASAGDPNARGGRGARVDCL